jgi:outer membrane protein
MRQHIRSIALVAVAAAGLAGLAGPVSAQEGNKLGMVNSQEILEKSVEGKRVFAQFQAVDKKYADGIARIDDQIKQLQNRLSAQRLTLTVEAAAGIQADIQKKQTERQRSIEDATRGMQDLQATTLDQIQREVMPIIEQIRKEKGIDLLFDLAKSGTVYYTPSLDLTDEVVRRYDALKAAPPVKK